MDLETSASDLKTILGLSHEPVAVKFLEDVAALDGFQMAGKQRYCQVLMGARDGKRLLLTADSIACPAAAWALGCYGCREATDLGESECVLGFPMKDLDAIVSSLAKLNEKAIPRVRGKTVYKALIERA
jgi:uncharacterized protein (DUF169 family)